MKWKNASKTNAAEKEALMQLFRSLSIYLKTKFANLYVNCL